MVQDAGPDRRVTAVTRAGCFQLRTDGADKAAEPALPCVSRRPGAAALQAGDSVPRGRFGGHFCRERGEVLQAPRDWRSEVLLKVPSLPSPHQE